jgi:hypothetical protein
MTVEWQPGKGRLGQLDPLIGTWVAEGDTPAPYRCERRFDRILGGRHVQLVATWTFPDGRSFEELVLFGLDPAGELRMWSFTSDGRQATGQWRDAWDVPRPNVAFETELPTGRTRTAYWPDRRAGGVYHVLERQAGRRWERLVEHFYRPA